MEHQVRCRLKPRPVVQVDFSCVARVVCRSAMWSIRAEQAISAKSVKRPSAIFLDSNRCVLLECVLCCLFSLESVLFPDSAKGGRQARVRRTPFRRSMHRAIVLATASSMLYSDVLRPCTCVFLIWMGIPSQQKCVLLLLQLLLLYKKTISSPSGPAVCGTAVPAETGNL
jgi:hypothetical protein